MTNSSLWYENINTYPKLEKDINCDILIIGGGLSGLSTAYYLAKKGQNVVVVDKGMIGCGTSGHTTAHVTIQHDLIYNHYLKEFGLKKTKKIAKANFEALEEIKKIVKEESIDCDLETTDSTLITNETRNIKKLEKEYEACRKVGINAFYSEKSNTISFLAGLTYSNQLHFNPIKYLNGLAKSILKYGGEIYQDTHILRIDNSYAHTNNLNIYYKKLVIATHNPIINFPGLYFTKMYQDRSYTFAFETTEKINQLYNSIDKNGYTLRPYNNYLLIGGKDHRCGTEMKINHQESLMVTLKQMYEYPKIYKSWHAQDGITIDKLPYIGKYSKKSKNTYVITGFGKWGMTNSNIAGRIVSDSILGNLNEYAHIYSPQRLKGPLAIAKLIYINWLVLKDYTIGLFRINRPRCSHLKCKTKYNKYTHSYDCPCHGSRFDKSGNCIDTPAIHGIKMDK